MIRIETSTRVNGRFSTLVVLMWKEDELHSVLKTICGKYPLPPGYADFKAEKGEKRVLYGAPSSIADKILLIGAGEKKKFTSAVLRAVIGDSVKYALHSKDVSLGYFLNGRFTGSLALSVVVEHTAETIHLAHYSFAKYKTKESQKKRCLRDATLIVERQGVDIRQAIMRAAHTAEATIQARDLINEPASVMTPVFFARTICAQARKAHVSARVFNKADIKRLGMEGLLAVSKGSDLPPQFMVLKYRGTGKKKKTICLVGKGICFDTGGLCIKPPSSMMNMKYDMAGAAVCAETIVHAHALSVPHDIIAVIPLCENGINGQAYRPSDILKMASGVTVEVHNTDAEGRLILADALWYAGKAKPDVIIDVATLTGAARVCLGDKAAAVMGNDETLIAALRESGERVGERLWQLPLWEDYQDDIKSDVADIKNVSSRGAGTITAAKFLSNFVPKNTAWAHLDIASTAWEEEGKSYIPKGASGFGVRLLLDYIQK